MKNRIILAAVGALSVVAGSAACPQTGSWVSSADPSSAKLTVDGQPQPVQGTPSCTQSGNDQIIQVGSQIDVQLLANGSEVLSVGLHTGAVNLQYFKGGYGPGNASFTKAGNTYTITGNISGSGLNGALKPFELEVTCP